jgi:pimeloyl-ACP methyl ester carboxylesterase
MSRPFFAITLAVLVGLTGMPARAIDLAADSGHLYQAGDVQLYTEISGTGPPVLFLHGGMSFFDKTFAKQKAYFSEFRTVIGIDQRGHGHSPDNARPFSYSEMADNTAALIEKLGIGPVDVVGHSDGGNVALLLALHHPQLVRRLVISGAEVRGHLSGLWAYLRFRLMSLDRFAASQPPASRRDYLRVSPDGTAHWLTIVAKSKDLWSTWVVVEPEELRAIRIPVLVMAGDRDSVSLESTIEIFHALPHAQMSILPGAGHVTMDDRADDFNRLTRSFLEEASPR